MRILADILLLFSVFFLPWWIVLLMAAAMYFVFDRFYELLVVGLLMDLLYGMPLERFKGFQFVLSSATIVLFLVLGAVKKRTRV